MPSSAALMRAMHVHVCLAVPLYHAATPLDPRLRFHSRGLREAGFAQRPLLRPHEL